MLVRLEFHSDAEDPGDAVWEFCDWVSSGRRTVQITDDEGNFISEELIALAWA